MGWSRWVWIGWVVAGLPTACTTSSKFSCQEDTQCVLGGEAGICTDDGLCAYPSEDCPTGWIYPPASPPGLANECAPGPAPGATESGSATGSTTSGSSSDASSSTTTSSSTTDPSTTTSVATDGTAGSTGRGTSDGASTGSNAECGDDESNSVTSPEVLNTPGCDADFSGRYHGSDDVDAFYKQFDMCGIDGFSVEPPDSADVVCIGLECTDAGAISCDDAELEVDGNIQRCCSYAPHSIDFNLNVAFGSPCEPLDEIYIAVQGSTNGVCDSYFVEVTHTD